MGKRIQYRFRVLKSLYPYASGVKRYWCILLAFSALTMTLEFLTPIVYKLFINEVLLSADLSKLGFVIGSYLLLYAVRTLASYGKTGSKYKLVHTVLFRVRRQILSHFFTLPFSDYETASIGDMKMRIDDDTKQIQEFAGTQTIDYLMACMTIVISSICLVSISFSIALFALVSIPLTFQLDHVISRYEKEVLGPRRENQQKMSSWLHASVQGWKEVKALNLSRRETRTYFRFLHHDMRTFSQWINFWTARVLIVPKIKNECFMQFGLYFIGGLLIISGNLKIGDLLVIAVYYSLLSTAIQTVSTSDAELQSREPITDRLMESLKAPAHAGDVFVPGNCCAAKNGNVPGKIAPSGSTRIVMKDVTFTYPDTEKAVIQNFDLTIEKGERVAITGRSGSGKTTLLKLITGMLTPDSGQISFSGIDLRDIDMEAMHKRMGYVMQENILFHTTIRENLLYGKRDASDEELIAACKKACIFDFIEGLPEGLDTLIGEKGLKLSGGQRQRLVLARMFLQDIDLFLFDEATSALDPYSESIVHDAIRNISKDKTIIVVAHRESSIALCDRIIKIS